MKISTTIAAAVAVGIACFFLGRWRAGSEGAGEPGTSSNPTKSQRIRVASRAAGGTMDGEHVKLPTIAIVPGSSADDVRKMTSAERMALLEAGATTGDGPNQIAILTGVIAALSKDELAEATRIFEGVQNRGNGQPKAVWESLWKQWGTLDPIGGLALFKPEPGPPGGGWFYNEAAGIHSGSSARCLMSAWLETDSGAALAWARQPQDTPQKAAAAALAMVHEAGGDAKLLEAAMRGLPADGSTLKACMKDYIDLASVGSAEGDASSTYEKLPQGLRQVAWPVVMKRLVLQDPVAAGAWLREHANEPGCDYDAAGPAISELAERDPAATVAWTSKLPAPVQAAGDDSPRHPADIAIHKWVEEDPAVAKAWLRGQSPDAPWFSQVSRFLQENRD